MPDVPYPLREPSQLAQLTGDRVVVLHSPLNTTDQDGMGGGDVDCAVGHLDPLWPLRLPRDWRLCGFSEYDIRGWAWVLDQNGKLLYLDTLDDPEGLGRYGFPTESVVTGDRPAPSAAIRATYLALKRLRKGIRDDAEWTRIRSLAEEDWIDFRSTLQSVAGPRLSRVLDEFVRGGRVDSNRGWEIARRLQAAHRVRTPRRATRVFLLQGRRVVRRIFRPTGWAMLIVGPDGSGKSTLARTLLERLHGVFRRELRIHWRPGLFPRPGGLIGKEQADASNPHIRPVHGKILSLGLLTYYWLDFFLGGWLRIWLPRLRSTLVVQERGWWDIVVDPHRYRLDVPSWFVRVLGAGIPHPDAALALEGPAKTLRARKAELPEVELSRQIAAWKHALPKRVPTVHLEASRPLDEVVDKAREETLRMLEGRAVSRLGAGWAQMGGNTTRWWLPRGPRWTAAQGLSVYQPITVRSRLGWETARLTARIGGFPLLPRRGAPPRAVREALAPHLPPRTTIAVSRGNHPGRYVALIVDDRGQRRGIAKIATESAGVKALEHEVEAIQTFGRLLQPPITAPRILAADPGLLLLEAVPWRPRLRPWRLEEDVARALGAFFRRNVRGQEQVDGAAHGDCAPWNLLRTEEGWVLVDWEAALAAAPPFYDLCHYLIQGHTLLGRPSWGFVVQGFESGTGWVGAAIRAYAEGAELAVDDAGAFLDSYLRTSRSIKDAAGDRIGSRARLRLLQRLAR